MIRRTARRGMTLLEAVLALLVLTTGVVAVFGMVGRISSANRSMAFQTAALDAFAQISAQIRDSRCDVEPDGTVIEIDDGLETPGAATWVNAAVTGSSIDFVGPDVYPMRKPQIAVSYRYALDPIPNAPLSFNIDVRVREFMNDAAKDADTLEDAYWIQVFPVKKICAQRVDATYRGEY